MEQGCHSWVDCLAAELFLDSCFSDTAFVRDQEEGGGATRDQEKGGGAGPS